MQSNFFFNKKLDPIQSNPIQPNPWMNPIHVQLCVGTYSKTRDLHGDGDDGITAVKLYDQHRGNSGDGDSIHGSTAVAVTELTVRLLFMYGLN